VLLHSDAENSFIVRFPMNLSSVYLSTVTHSCIERTRNTRMKDDVKHEKRRQNASTQTIHKCSY